jgi:hypothetical protein
MISKETVVNKVDEDRASTDFTFFREHVNKNWKKGETK